MKKIVLALVLAGTLFISSCGIQKHLSLEVKRPSNLEDTVTIIGKFWGLSDLIKDNVEGNSKFAIFMADASKNCDFTITKSSNTLNDTLTFTLACDSNFSKGKAFIDKLKK